MDDGVAAAPGRGLRAITWRDGGFVGPVRDSKLSNQGHLLVDRMITSERSEECTRSDFWVEMGSQRRANEGLKVI